MKRVLFIAAFAFACSVNLASADIVVAQEHGDEHGSAHGEHHEGIDWAQLAGSFINLGILLGVIAWKGGPALREFLANRKSEVVTALDEAAAIKAKAEAKYAEYQTRLANLDNELAEIRAEIVKSGQSERERIIAEAEHKAKRMRADAEFLIDQQIKQLRIDLQAEMALAGLNAAEKILRERTSSDDQQRFAQSFVHTLNPSSKEMPRVTQMPMPRPPGRGSEAPARGNDDGGASS